jgi:cell volume regulation protein A
VSAKDVILTLFWMLGAGLLSVLAAGYLKLPRMLILLGAGAIIGPSVTGAIDVPLRSIGPQLLLTLGVSIILFYGGLGLSTRVLSPVAVGLFLLVIPGVVLTAVVTGFVAAKVFGLPYSSGLLIGAALAPTDPAILIPLFERLHVKPKMSQTIIAESALNDPTGAVLTLAVVGVLLSGHVSLGHTAWKFTENIAVSTVLGAVLGVALSLAVSRFRFGVWRESAAVVMVVGIAGGYVGIDHASGSGYLGAFIAGLVVGNMREFGSSMHPDHERDLRTFVATMADAMVMLVFLTLGANLPWHEMASNALPALAVIGTLLFVARPIAVLACLLPDRRGRWTRQELVFMGWARETGAMPAALAGLIVGMGVPHGELVVTCVAFAIVATLLIQSTTKPWLARRLGLLNTDPDPDPRHAHAAPEPAEASAASAG